MAADIGLRGMETGDFKLATNVKDAGNFDDLVKSTNVRPFFLHRIIGTCWQTDTDSQSDEQNPPGKRRRKPNPQTKRTGGAHDGGQQFQNKMAALGRRGMERGDNIVLATNVKDAGNFDDLVNTTNVRRSFLQGNIDTCRRRETESETAEEPSTAEQQHTTDTQPKGPGSVKDGGHQFEMKMAALIGLRGLQRGDNFELFSNIDGAGNFDDLVYTAGGRRYFLQLKHADNPDKKKLTKGDLETLLQNCLESYCAIKRGDTFKDIPVDNSDFIIYTNRELTPELLEHKRRQRTDDIFFKTSDKGEIFSFSKDEKNKKFDVYTLVENSAIKRKERSESREFLNKLIMVTGQKGQRDLDEVLIEEIRENDAANVDNEVYKTELLEFKTLVEIWSRDNKGKMTATMFRNWLQKAKIKPCASVVRSLFASCAKKLVRTGIEFSVSEISWLQAALSNKSAIHLRSDALALCSILLLDCLPQSKCIFVTFELLQSNKNMLLHAWLGGHWDCLIVSCDATVQQSDITDTYLKMSEIIKPDPSNKRVIILTEYSVQQVTGFVPIDHRFKFEQLSEESQAMVLDKKIDFQGCEVTMRSVLQRHGNVEHVLGPELVTDLITEETAVNIGGKLHVNTGYYAPRVLERKLCLKSNVLRNPNDVFFVSGITVSDLCKFVSSAETIGYVSPMTDFTQDMSSRIFVISNRDVENTFLEICRKLKEKSLHWLEYKNGRFWWKMSRGGTDSLLYYVDAEKTRADKRIIAECLKSCRCEVKEESIWDLGERTVLVVAEPGMGKSSTTTHVAWHTKERDPTSWVVHINCNQINAATFNLDTLVEFLCIAAFPDSKYTDINRSLLKQALQSSGNVTVLMDGFDEISPTYADKAAVFLTELTKTKVGKVWVTSRPVEKERLEKQLSVIAFSMKNLSHNSQQEMLCKLLIHKGGGKKSELLKFTNQILFNLKRLVYDENFTGGPLYCTMIAAVCEKDMETCLNSEVWIQPRIYLVNLYEEFVKRKLHIYLTEEQKTYITNSSVPGDLELLKTTYLIGFEKCALAAILPPTVLASLHNKKTDEETKPFLERVEIEKYKTGVVMNVVEGKPQFVHRTFAEYFTARWFSKNFESNRSVLEHILFDRKYSFVTDMFYRMLAKDCPLHCAVLERNVKRVEILLKAGWNVNALDKGGRNIMHLIAKCKKGGFLYKTCVDNYIGIFPDYKVSLDNKDCVLQWTPLQYAVKAEDWYNVEWLLQRNVDRSGLDMIRQRAHDTDYIDPIIIESAQKGHTLLLKFIHSIGVNIHQASSMDFSSPLHAAIQGQQLRVVKWLIKHGADCNTRYSDGQTPLFDAVIEGSLVVVRVLVEEGGASLDVRDDCSRTVFDWANDCAADQSHSIDQLEKWKVIAKYLEEREYKESTSVLQYSSCCPII